MLRSYGTLIGSLLLFVLVGVARMQGWLGEPIEAASLSLFGFVFQLPLHVQLGACLLLMLIDVYLMLRIISNNSLYSTRTYFAPSLFLMLICGAPFALPFTAGLITLTLTLISISILLSSYEQTRAISEYVSAFVFFGIATLFVPKWMYLLPFLFIGCSFIGTLTFRAFLASLLGLIAPYWIAAGVLFIIDEFSHFTLPFLEMARFSPIDYAHLPLEQIFSFALVTLFSLPAVFTLPRSFQSLNERTRVAYSFLITLLVGLLLLSGFQPTLFENFFPLFACLTSLLVNQMLLAIPKRKNWMGLLTIIVLLIVYLTRPLWMLLSTF